MLDMSQQQLKLHNIYKVKSNVIGMNMERKKKNLSLTKSPMKSPKLTPENLNVPGIISLISDDEENQDESELNCSATSLSSDTTQIYTDKILNTSQSTPTKSKSLTKRRVYFSPNKKRTFNLRSPSKTKRKLALSQEPQNEMDDKFLEITESLDDITMFFVRIVYQFLNDDNLKQLLNEISVELLNKCIQVNKHGMKIVCRLYWQKEQWCTLDKIKKSAGGKKSQIDDSTAQEAINSLVERDIITVAEFNGENHVLEFDEMVQVLKLKDILEICRELKLKVKTKAEAIEALKKFMSRQTNITAFMIGARSNNQSRTLKKLGAKLGTCYKLSDLVRNTLKELYILMYLGMNNSIIREKKLEITLLNEKIGQETYPIGNNISLDNASVVFGNRQEFEHYLNACSIHDDFLSMTNSTDKCQLSKTVYNLYKEINEEEMLSYTKLPEWLRQYTRPHIYALILEECIKDLKKDNFDIKLAIEILSLLINQDIFRQHKKAEWFAEKALILDKYLSAHEEAAKVLIEGFNSNLPFEFKMVLNRRALKIANRKTNRVSQLLQEHILDTMSAYDILEKNIKATHIYKVPMYNGGKGKIKFETKEASKASGRVEAKVVRDAEEHCLYEYITVRSEYTHGHHWEGKILTTIFFLLFWDIIYAPLRGLRGIYLSRYQIYPLDLFTNSFYTNRKLLIDERLTELEESTTGEMIARMNDTWESRPEAELSGIHRDIGWENIRDVAICLGTRRVVALCRRLATNYCHTHSGFPDLTLWNIDTKKITFVEVKTDSDKPSMKQIQWMHYMKRWGIDAEFCYIGGNTMRARSRNCEESDDE